VRNIALLMLLLSGVEVLFTGSNIMLIAAAKMQHLPFSGIASAFIGFGLSIAMAYGLWSFGTVLWQNYFRNSDADAANDADTKLNGVYAITIILICGGMMITGVAGAQNVGEDYLAYQAHTQDLSAPDASRTEREAAARSQFTADVDALDKSSAAAAAAAQASAKRSAAAWRAKAKGTTLNIAWANKQAAAFDAQAEAASSKQAAIAQASRVKLEAVRDAQLREAQTEHAGATSDITTKNTIETDKSEKSKTQWRTGLTYLSILTVPLLLLFGGINGRIMVKSGMYLQSPFDDTLHEGSLWAKFTSSVGHFVGNHLSNLFARLYNAAPEKEAFKDSAPTLPASAQALPYVPMHVAPPPLKSTASNRIGFVQSYKNADEPLQAVAKDIDLSAKKDNTTPYTAGNGDIQPDLGVYTSDTAVGEGLKYRYTPENIAETIKVEETDNILAKSEYSPELSDLLLRYKEGNKHYHQNNVKKVNGEYEEHRMIQMKNGLNMKAAAANDLYDRGYLVKKQGKPFVLVHI
jgi:hypothetical protein